MSIKYVMESYELLDSPSASGEAVRNALIDVGCEARTIEVRTVEGPKGHTDFVKVWFHGRKGKHGGGTAPTLGIVGRLGGVEAVADRKSVV